MAIKPGFWTRLHGLITLALISAALYFLLVEHGHTNHKLQASEEAKEVCRRGLEEDRNETNKKPE